MVCFFGVNVGFCVCSVVAIGVGFVCAVGVIFFGFAVVATKVEDDLDVATPKGAATGFEVTPILDADVESARSLFFLSPSIL